MTPHDSLFRAAFADPCRAAALLRHTLPRPFVEQLCWNDLEAMHGLFVDRRLDLHATDLLFRAPLHG